MRILLLAAGSMGLAACGGPDTSQANNVQGNISNEARPAAAATGSVVTGSVPTGPSMFAPAPSRDAARKIMHDRHEGMEGIGKANKVIKQELNASPPNLGLVRYSARRMAAGARDATDWFHAGTGPEFGKTGAKPEIWQNPEDVAAKLAAFQKATQAFETVAQGTDVVAMKASFASLSGTCKACHDKYRSQMHH
jgi:cytochrome c556